MDFQTNQAIMHSKYSLENYRKLFVEMYKDLALKVYLNKKKLDEKYLDEEAKKNYTGTALTPLAYMVSFLDPDINTNGRGQKAREKRFKIWKKFWEDKLGETHEAYRNRRHATS